MDKPDALLLAAELDKFSNPWDKQAAAELRRLHAQRDALLEVVNKLVDHIDFIPTDPYYRDETRELMGAARAAIKAAEEIK